MSSPLPKLIVISASLLAVLASNAQPLPVVTYTESGGTLIESSSLFADIIWTPVPGQPYETWFGPTPDSVGFHNGFIEWFEPDGSGLVNRIDGGSFEGPPFSLATSDITRTNLTISGPPTQQPGALVTIGFVNIQDPSTGLIVPIQASFQFVDLDDVTSPVPETQSTVLLLTLACAGLGLFGIFQSSWERKPYVQATQSPRQGSTGVCCRV
jgi:hypothetical protein